MEKDDSYSQYSISDNEIHLPKITKNQQTITNETQENISISQTNSQILQETETIIKSGGSQKKKKNNNGDILYNYQQFIDYLNYKKQTIKQQMYELQGFQQIKKIYDYILVCKIQEYLEDKEKTKNQQIQSHKTHNQQQFQKQMDKFFERISEKYMFVNKPQYQCFTNNYIVGILIDDTQIHKKMLGYFQFGGQQNSVFYTTKNIKHNYILQKNTQDKEMIYIRTYTSTEIKLLNEFIIKNKNATISLANYLKYLKQFWNIYEQVITDIQTQKMTEKQLVLK